MKIKINSDDDLPINRPLFLSDVVILSPLLITHKYFWKKNFTMKKNVIYLKIRKVNISKRTSIEFLKETLRNAMLDFLIQP